MPSRNKIMSDAKIMVKEYLTMDLFREQFPVDFLAEWLTVRIENTYFPGGTIVDLGGGFSVTNAVLVDLGMRVHCVDLMTDYFIHSSLKNPMKDQFDFLTRKGVNFIHSDLLTYQFEDFRPGSVDVVCSYHGMGSGFRCFVFSVGGPVSDVHEDTNSRGYLASTRARYSVGDRIWISPNVPSRLKCRSPETI